MTWEKLAERTILTNIEVQAIYHYKRAEREISTISGEQSTSTKGELKERAVSKEVAFYVAPRRPHP